MPANRPKLPVSSPHRQLARLRDFIAFFCCGIAIVLWAAIHHELDYDRAEYSQAARRNADNLALAFERHVDANIKTVDMALLHLRETLRRSPAGLDGSARAIAHGPLYDMLAYISLIDSDGRIAYSTLAKAGIGTDLSDREYFLAQRDADEDRLFIGQAVFGRASQEWIIPFSRRLEDGEGRFAGILVFALRPEFFSRFYSAVDLGAKGVATLLRDGPTVLARGSRLAPPDNPLGKSINFDPPLAADGKSTIWTLASPIDGIVRIGAYRHHRQYPLAVYVGLAEDEVLGAYRRHVREWRLVGGMLTLAILGLGVWLWRLYRRLQLAQQATEESETRFRQLYMQAPLAYLSLDAQGCILDVNEPWMTLFAYRRDEVVGRPLADFVAEDSLPQFLRHCQTMLASGRADGFEIEIRRSDGDSRLVAVESRLGSVDGAGTRPLHCILYDVTAARRQQAALKASEARLRGIVENIGVVTWELDLPAWNFSYVSPQVEAMFGYPADAWLKPGFWPAHLHPDDRDWAVQLCASCTARCEDHDFEYRFLARDGRVVWLRDLVKVIADTAGQPVKLTGVMVDITQTKAAEADLRRSEQKLRSYIQNAVDGICVLDDAGRYIEVNPALTAMLGMAQDALLGHGFDLSFESGSPDHAAARALFRQLREQGHCRGESVARRADGSRLVLDINAITLEPGRHLVLVRDMSERWAAEESRRLAQAVFEATGEAIFVTDSGGRILSSNPAFSAITGWSAAEVRGQTPQLLKSGRHTAEFYAEIWRQLHAANTWSGEIWNRRKNGEVYPAWLCITAVRDAGGEITRFVAIFSDITQRKQHEETIWRQANFDALTGLANRNLFHDRLEHALARARRNRTTVGLLFIDLDRFKWINDTLGHAAGDQLLIEAARRLRVCVREEDTVARLGGDEFTIILQELSEPELITVVAEKALQSLAAPFRLGDGEQFISGSIGITAFPNDGDDAQTLLRNADIAMYRAKEGGRNRYQFYSPSMQADALARVLVENELRRALAEKAFSLCYQPIVAADSGRLVGGEALLRWSHPGRGIVFPADFVPVAEETGLIVPIGEWVLDEACRQWREWVDAGHPPLQLAVNVSSVQFRAPHFPESLAGMLRRHGLLPGFLTLEITESLLIESPDPVEESFAAIKALGVRYALDDFGTGYSSLSSLKRFPIDFLKIDGSFIANCPGDAGDSHLVEAIVQVAHSLGLRVIAEGVESAEQQAFLRRLGCDDLQGFLLGHPLDPAAFAALFDPEQTPADLPQPENQ